MTLSVGAANVVFVFDYYRKKLYVEQRGRKLSQRCTLIVNDENKSKIKMTQIIKKRNVLESFQGR